jgi:Tfp pilus assembly protein PilN
MDFVAWWLAGIVLGWVLRGMRERRTRAALLDAQQQRLREIHRLERMAE